MKVVRRFLPRWLQPSDLAVIVVYFWAWTLWYALAKHQSFRQAEAAALPYTAAFAVGWIGTNLLHPLVERRYRAWRLRRPMRHDPAPPQNVRLILTGGAEIPVECVYVGQRGGIDEWKAVTQIKLDRHALITAQVACDVLPPRTAVVLEVASPSGPEEQEAP